MKSVLNANIVAPPKLTPAAREELMDTIKSLRQGIDKGRVDRVQAIKEIREMHQDHYDHRVKPDSIYELSNIGVPLMKGVANSLASKIEEELLSAESPLVAKPENIEDKALADKGTKYWNWELMSQIRYYNACSMSINTLCSEGTSITKRAWRTDCSYFTRTEPRLHDEIGVALVLPDGNPINDPRAEVLVVAHQNRFAAMLGMKQRFLMTADGRQGPELTPKHKWVDVTLKDKVVHYDNAELVNVLFEDFICDTTVDRIEKSALVAHDYSKKLHEIWESVFQSLQGEDVERGFEESGWIKESLQKLEEIPDSPSGEAVSSEKTAQADAPLAHFGEAISKEVLGICDKTKLHRRLQFSETYLKYDLDGDGWPEDIIVIYEKSTCLPIWIEYHARVYADCKLPFNVHGLYRVQNRWWSLGPYEYLKSAQDYVDKVFNRMNYRGSMNANPMGWVKPDNFIKAPKEWGPGERCELKSSFTIDQSMGFVVMPSLESVEWQHFQFFISLIQLITGVSNAAQGDVSSLPSTATATGINSIIDEGNKMYRMLIRRQKDTREEEVGGIISLIQQNANKDRVFRYAKGFDEVTATMTAEEIRDMDYDVRFQLLKSGTDQKVQSSQAALAIMKQFMEFPPEYQVRLRELFVRLLLMLGVVEAEDIVPSRDELQKDMDKDGMLNQMAEKLGAVAQQIDGAQIQPEKQLAAQLMEIAGAMQQLAARPPDEGSQAAPMEEPQQAASSAPSLIPSEEIPV